LHRLGRLHARIMIAVAKAEQERQAERQKLAFEQAAIDGKRFTGCPRPFGHCDDHVTAHPVAGLDEDRALELCEALARHSLVAVDGTGPGPRSRMLACAGGSACGPGRTCGGPRPNWSPRSASGWAQPRFDQAFSAGSLAFGGRVPRPGEPRVSQIRHLTGAAASVTLGERPGHSRARPIGGDRTGSFHCRLEAGDGR
jgi:hypothetical protein